MEKSVAVCPICETSTETKRAGTPYFACPGCGLLFQDPAPQKVWHGPHETWVGEPMPEQEKRVNEWLANYLFDNVMRGKPGRTLDVGASYCWLAHCLAQRGCHAYAWDPSEEIGKFRKDYPDVHYRYCDFEDMNTPNYRGLSLIIFCHSYEHLYRPLDAMRKCRRMLAKDGALFIRMPDSGVRGVERDFTEGHYKIHPYCHSLSSVAEICARTNTFTIVSAAELLPGQRDIILSPI